MKASRIALPRLPNGRVQKAMPKAYARPSIAIGAGVLAERREWTATPASSLKVGDIVPGVGRIFSVTESVETPHSNSGLSAAEIVDQVFWTVTIQGGVNNVKVYPGNASVWAFTVKKTAE